MMYSWIEAFEEKFEIEAVDQTSFRLIVGQQKYLQELGEQKLVVEYDNKLHDYYQDFPEVAFLVSKWVKIQDSLEMLFNLLSGTSTKSLEILSYLRSNEINTYEFANYMAENKNLILINRYKLLSKSTKKSEHHKIRLDLEIVSLVEKIQCQKRIPIKILFVGKNNFQVGLKGTEVLKNKIGWIIHPSGANLSSKANKEYFDAWYNLSNNCVKHYSKIESVKLEDFKVL